MKDNSKMMIIIVSLLAIAVIVYIYFTNNKPAEKKDNEIKIVENYSNFYTVNSCIYRLITYITSNDTDSLYLLLTDDYKNKFKVTKASVASLFKGIDSDSTFVSKKMYYEELNKNVTKYYVYGKIEKNQLYDDQELSNINGKDAYYIVYLNTDKEIFSIEPYDGSIFISGDKYE